MPRKSSRNAPPAAPPPQQPSRKRPPAEKEHKKEEDDSVSVSPLNDLWKEAFPVGTEWVNYDRVYEIDWDFSNLEKAFQVGGKLHGKKVFLFGCTEPQMVSFGDTDRIVQIPAIVAVLSPQAPSDKLGVKSVQRVEEDIIPMKEMKMDWVPYLPADLRDNVSVERYKSSIFTLKCVQRRVALKQLKEERVKKYDYCLPHFSNPLKQEEKEPDTDLSLIYTLENGSAPPLVFSFDWRMDDIEEFTDDLINEGNLPPEEKEKFKDFVKQEVAQEKKKLREAREERRKRIEEMSVETKAFYENILFYKFYPVGPSVPDVSKFKSPFINRYYGKASEVL